MIINKLFSFRCSIFKRTQPRFPVLLRKTRVIQSSKQKANVNIQLFYCHYTRLEMHVAARYYKNGIYIRERKTLKSDDLLQKQEPMEEERNDSGINSGSEFHSSSPGSENSQDNLNIPYTSPQVPHSSHQMNYYNTPVANRSGYFPQHLMYNEHPLTPPNSEMLASPKNQIKAESADTTLTPCASPSNQTQIESEDGDSLRKLQMALEKNGLLPAALSPKPSECSAEDEAKSDNEEEYDEQGLRIPKVNSHGKVKTFKCKSCDFVAITKLDFWEHTKNHIKADKLLTCPKCPFVTEYKHHLEYHLRNHFGSKPFKCTKCSYSCVNKSMLNSHLKSHSNVYQYRCSDCSYATKYCHSLKLHLRKYSHKPAMVLNPDGTPNPLPIIDVYGTRRGPKVKSQNSKSEEQEQQSPKTEQLLPFALNQLMMNATQQQMQLPFPYPFFGSFPGAIPNPLLLQNLEKMAQERQSRMEEEDDEEEEEEQMEGGALDLSKPDGSSTKNRRKGRAYKLTPSSGQFSDEEESAATTTMFSNVEVVETKDEKSDGEEEKDSENLGHNNNNNNKDEYSCQYCSINFGDAVLYTMHMGYHGYKNPFTCNMCGEECKDKVAFFLHIARTPHS